MEILYFENLYYEQFLSHSESKEAVIFIHGYPGTREDKNRDLVDLDAPYDRYLLHHLGLGKSRGQFSFQESVASCRRFTKYIQKKGYSKVHLIGHSWGGFVALAMLDLALDLASKIILISPFLKIPAERELSLLVSEVYKDGGEYIGHMKEIDVHQDLCELAKTHNFEHFKNFLTSHSIDLKIIQALNDAETPVEIAREFVDGLFGIDYFEAETDHSFLNYREPLKQFICHALAESC